MAGITNYYHGESGLVADHGYVTEEGERTHVLRLEDNPHRELTRDYGSDIGVDPLLEVGQRAHYIRLDGYTGIWIREQDRFYPELQKAIARVIRDRSATWMNPGVSEETRKTIEKQPYELPATEASFFLSFSSKNIMLARQIFEHLKHDAKLDVWFDLDQEGESPEHTKRIERWLRDAVYSSRGFILLWTKAAKKSRWVHKEVLWASEKASRDPGFHFVVLKLDDEPIPPNLIEIRYLVDCHNLWPMHGVNEELFATLFWRQGRTAWIEEHRRRGIEPEDDGNSVLYGEKYGYEPFQSDSGVAISLQHWEEDGEFCWRLNYEKDRRLHKAYGRGETQAIDLGIRTGDDVGLFIYGGRSLWMRSRDLRIRPSAVWRTYIQRTTSPVRTEG